MTPKNLDDLLNRELVRDLFLKYQNECHFSIDFQVVNIHRQLVLSPKTYALLYEISDKGFIKKIRANASSEETRERAFKVMKFLEHDFSGPKFFIPKVYFYDSDYNLIAYENIEEGLLIDELNNLNLVTKISLAAQWLHHLHELNKPIDFELARHKIFFNFRSLRKFYPQLASEGPAIVESLQKKISSPADGGFQPRLIHGDFQPNNIITNNNKITVFDFNDSQIDDPALDLAKFLTQLKVMLFRFANIKDYEDLKTTFLINYRLNFSQNNFQVYQKLYYLQILCSLSASLAEEPEAKKTLPKIYEYWENSRT